MLPSQRGLANAGQHIQFMAIPAEEMPPLSFSEFRHGGSFHRGYAGGSFRGGVDSLVDVLPEIKVLLIVWMLHRSMNISKFKLLLWDCIIF